MHAIKILLCDTGKQLTLKLDVDTQVYDICRDLYTKIGHNINASAEDYGLFVPDKDPSRSYWLDSSKPICYYPLSDKNVILEYKIRLRRLIIRTMDETRKVLQVDDSKTIQELLLPICSKMGISNYDEYSLIHEIDEEERMKTMTLKKGKTQIRDFEKMEKMKLKLKTDDELNWLPHSKTLRQLGIIESDELLLRRKYFFSDQNVDARDPIQLNLLYVQLRDAIINGTHPVSIEEAIQLAGIQSQVELGNFNADRLKQVHSMLKHILPKEYIKTKGIEKKIGAQYESLSGNDDKEAKVKYAQLCRSLKTYGITFFLVKEKMRAKNKLVPRLMGISKEYVMRVDEKTKEVLQSWPLTTIRRYAATASLFSLDFGDYTDENYVIQTLEGEKIAQLIAGYIDIILKKQKAKDKHDIEADEETAMIEENVAPSKANVISHNEFEGNRLSYQQNQLVSMAQIGQRNNVVQSMGSISAGHVDGPQSIIIRNDSRVNRGHVNAPTKKFEIRDLSQPKRALMVRIGENLKILQAATDDLDKHIGIAKLGHDESARTYRKQTFDVTSNRIKGNLMSMTMATGNLLSMIQNENDSEEEDYGKIDTAITTIGFTTNKLIDNVNKIYEVTYDSPENAQLAPDLIGAAKSLLDCFQDLLNASRPIKSESDQKLAQETNCGLWENQANNSTSLTTLQEQEDQYKQFSGKSLLEAVNKVGEASKHLLELISLGNNGQIAARYPSQEGLVAIENDWELRDILLTDAKQIAGNVSHLVKLVKEAYNPLKDVAGPEQQNQLIQAAKQTGQATSMLISAAKVVACTADQPLSQQQLYSAGRYVTDQLAHIIQLCEPLNQSAVEMYTDLYREMTQLNETIGQCVAQMQSRLQANSIASHQDQMVTDLITASEKLPASLGNRNDMVTQATILANAGSQLISCLSGDQNIPANSQSGTSNALANSARSVLNTSQASIDSDRQRRLIVATQALTDAVEKLVQSTKVCLQDSEPNSANQQALIHSAQHMISVAHMTAGEILRQRVSKGLEYAGRQTAITADQLLVTSQEAVKSARMSNYQMSKESQDITEVVLPAVVYACSKIRENPSDSESQNNLLNTCQQLVKSLEQLLISSEALGPQVRDASLRQALQYSMQSSNSNLTQLKQSVHQAESVMMLQPYSTSSAATVHKITLLDTTRPFNQLYNLIDSAAESITKDELYPLPGETVESMSVVIGYSSARVKKTLNDLYSQLNGMNIDLSGANGNSNNNSQGDLIKGARDLMDSMDRLLRGARSIASFSDQSVSNQNNDDASNGKYQQQVVILDTAKQILHSGEDVIQAVKLGSVGAIDLANVKESMDQMCRDIDKLTNQIPSYRQLNELSDRMKQNMEQFSHSTATVNTQSAVSKSHNQLQSEFIAAVAVFNQTLNELLSGGYSNTTGAYSNLVSVTHQLSESHSQMLDCAAQLMTHPESSASQDASSSSSPQQQHHLVSNLRVLNDNSHLLLDQLMLLQNSILCTGSINTADSEQYKQDLFNAAGSVSDSINKLLSSCTSSLPKSQQLCDVTQRQMEALKSGLLSDTPSSCVNNQSYNECLDVINSNCEELTNQIKAVPSLCKNSNSNSDSFCAAITKVAETTTELLKSATQANYHLGVIQSSEINTPQTQPMSVDNESEEIKETIRQHSLAIRKACSQLSNEDNSELACRQLANDIKQWAGASCQLLKQLIQKSSNEQYNGRLIECGKVVAESAADLIKTMSSGPRSLARANRTPAMEANNQDYWSLACDNVSKAVDQLVRVSSGETLSATPMTVITIAEHAKQAQLPIYQASVDVVDSSISLMRATSALVKDQSSIPANQAFIINQKTFADNLRKLRDTVSYCAPGQQEFMEAEEETRHLMRKLTQPVNLNHSTPVRTQNANINQELALILSSLKQLKNNINLVKGIITKPDKYIFLGKAMSQAGNYLAPIAESVEKLSVSLPHSRDRGEIVELSRTILEAYLALVQNGSKLSSDGSVKSQVEDDLESLEQGSQDLLNFVEGLVKSQGTLDSFVSTVEKLIETLTSTDNSSAGEVEDLAKAHTRIVRSVQALNGDINEFMGSSTSGGIKSVKLHKRESVRTNGDLSKNKGAVVEEHGSVKRLVQHYEELIQGVCSVNRANTQDPNMSNQLKRAALSIGQSTIELIKYEKVDAANNILSRLREVINALEATAKGTQACVIAQQHISCLIDEVDTAILFASSGTLTMIQDPASGAQPVQSVTQIKEQFVSATKSLVNGLQKMCINVNGKQDELAANAEQSVAHATELTNLVKSSAYNLHQNPSLLGLANSSFPEISNAQILLLNGTRDLLVSIVDFVNYARITSSNVSDEDIKMIKVKFSHVTKSVESLITSIKSLEDSGLRGTRALETALEAMNKELNALELWSPESEINTREDDATSPDFNKDNKTSMLIIDANSTDYTLDENNQCFSSQNLVLTTRDLVTASQKAMTAIQTFKQEDMVIAANFGRKSIQEFSRHLRGTVAKELELQRQQAGPTHIFSQHSSSVSSTKSANDEETASRMIENGKGAVQALIAVYENLTKAAQSTKANSAPHKMQMTLASRRVTHAIHEVNLCAAKFTTVEEDSEDSDARSPEAKAEDELNEAARQIEAAAKKLAQLKPKKRASIKRDPLSGLEEEELTFDGQILVGCQSIVHAMKLLMASARVAQQELVEQGRDVGSVRGNSAWSQGLISAAKLVAAAADNLCEAAREVVNSSGSAGASSGGSSKLIGAAKQVASSTAHLLIACQVRAADNSSANKGLQAAGAAVRKATEALVKEAQNNAAAESDNLNNNMSGTGSIVNSMRSVIQAQADIVAKEKELEMLRNRYNTIRQEHITTHPDYFEDN